jgi:formate hydrogenlyase subunit 3/multisubunit Na+/H+ antiporter MnhD subunit
VAEHDDDLQRLIEVRVRRVNALASGLVAGLLAGLGLFLATNWLVLKGGHPLGPHLVLLSQFFIGYRVSFLGSLIGFAYGFVLALVAVFCCARLYNWVVDLRYPPQVR